MSETTQDPNTKKGLITPLIITALLIYFIAADPSRAWNILLVLLGFSMVIFVHELGHFLAAKAVGIQTEEFAVGFGKVLLGVQKVTNGLEFRLLPNKLPDGGRKSAYTFTLPFGSTNEGETEYQLRMIPLGGFVKMLGQEDIGADKPSENPRSFGNKAIWKRVIVISAGVTVNVITGFIVFLAVFNHGVDLPPAVIGGVFSDSVADKAGLEPGDEVLAINGQENISFMDLKLASAFTSEGESLTLKVQKDDGTTTDLSIKPQADEKQGMKIMGVLPAGSLTLIPKKSIQGDDRENILTGLEALGLSPGDTIIAVDGQPVSQGHKLIKALNPDPGQGRDQVTLTARHQNATDGEAIEKQVVVKMRLQTINAHLTRKLGIEPLISVGGFAPKSPARQSGMKQGDLITKVGTIPNPTSEELTEYVNSHSGQAITFEVQRQEAGQTTEVKLQITPQEPAWWQRLFGNKNPPRIGISFFQALPGRSLQAEAIVAQTKAIDKDHTTLALPRGAKITAIAGQTVANWQEVLTQLENHHGQTVELQYRLSGQQNSDPLPLAIPEDFRAGLAYRSGNEIIQILPALLEPYERTFKGSNWTQCLGMGTAATKTFLAQSYLTIKSMISGSMSTKNVSGPVGILTLSYNIVDSKSMTFYFYFMAIISMCIAVFNFLPIPIVDGGLIVMLLIEKIKGSPVSLRVQEVINYAGLIMIGGFFLYVTFNDIARLVNG